MFLLSKKHLFPLPKKQFHDIMPIITQKKKNMTGIPEYLKYIVEYYSGFLLDDVKVHYYSQKPLQLHACAYTQGTNIYIAPKKEIYLLHELIHVIQQKQGIVQPTMVQNGLLINNNPLLELEADMFYIRESPPTYRKIDVIQCMFDSQILAKNIKPPEGTEAHHIIPIQVIQEALELWTFSLTEFDKEWNGIALPSKQPTKNLPTHHGSHNNYTDAVRKYIGRENMQKLVTDLNYARQTAQHFRNMIEDYIVEGVTRLNHINFYFRSIGRQAMYDFIHLENLEMARIKNGYLSNTDWANLLALYFKIKIDGELTEEEKNWVRVITNNGMIISNIEGQTYMQERIGMRLKGLKE